MSVLDESKTLDFCGSQMNLGYLSHMLNEINRSGGVTVKGIVPGSVNLLEIGAFLAEVARKSAELEREGKI